MDIVCPIPKDGKKSAFIAHDQQRTCFYLFCSFLCRLFCDNSRSLWVSKTYFWNPTTMGSICSEIDDKIAKTVCAKENCTHHKYLLLLQENCQYILENINKVMWQVTCKHKRPMQGKQTTQVAGKSSQKMWQLAVWTSQIKNLLWLLCDKTSRQTLWTRKPWCHQIFSHARGTLDIQATQNIQNKCDICSIQTAQGRGETKLLYGATWNGIS